jgi:hypothetical protein
MGVVTKEHVNVTEFHQLRLDADERGELFAETSRGTSKVTC